MKTIAKRTSSAKRTPSEVKVRALVKMLCGQLKRSMSFIDNTNQCGCSPAIKKKCKAYGGGCYIRGEFGEAISKAQSYLLS